jgi:hydrogenase maturation protein HypF
LQLIQAKEFGLSSSAGRLFDAASSILGLCHKITYEAEAAVLLEMFATKPQSKIENFDFSIRKEKNCYIIDWQPLFSSLINDIRLKKDYAHLAYKFHFTFAVIIREMAEILRKDYNLNKVALSGGVFQNMLLLELAIKLLEKEGFSVYYHRRFPFNDSAISVGQVVVANENI